MKRTLLIIFLLSTLAYSAPWRMAQDEWNTHDKPAHTGTAYIVNDLFNGVMDWKLAACSTIFAGLTWEVKDGFIRWEQVGYWGGDGFSRKDLIADLIGIGLNVLVRQVIFRPQKDKPIREYDIKGYKIKVYQK